MVNGKDFQLALRWELTIHFYNVFSNVHTFIIKCETIKKIVTFAFPINLNFAAKFWVKGFVKRIYILQLILIVSNKYVIFHTCFI